MNFLLLHSANIKTHEQAVTHTAHTYMHPQITSGRAEEKLVAKWSFSPPTLQLKSRHAVMSQATLWPCFSAIQTRLTGTPVAGMLFPTSHFIWYCAKGFLHTERDTTHENTESTM